MQTESSHCYHCGLPNPDDKISSDMQQQTAFFCCYGCQAVALSITEAGLHDFYSYKQTTINAASAGKHAEQLSIYDSQEMQQHFVEHQPQKSVAYFSVEGLSCSACVWLIEQRLQKETSIFSAQVNLAQERLSVFFDPDRIKISEIMLICQQVGYQLAPFKQSQQQQQQNKKIKSYLFKLAISGIASMQSMMNAVALYSGDIDDQFTQLMRFTSLLLSLPVVFYCAADFFKHAIRDLRTRHLTMDTPVAIAIGLAFIASVYGTLTQSHEVYFESLCMFTFFLLIGRYLEYRTRVSYGSIGNQLVQQMPQVCRLVNQKVVATNSLQQGDEIVVHIGDIFAIDCQISQGTSDIDIASINGEFTPMTVSPGVKVKAGSLNLSAPVQAIVSEQANQHNINQIQQLIDQASQEKTRSAQIADHIARYFVAAVLLLSSAGFIIWWFIDPSQSFNIALSILVVTCPCALSLATPTAQTQAINRLSKAGLLITRSHVLEHIGHIKHALFDKTGTLTEGKYSLNQVLSFNNLPVDKLNNIAANLQQLSEHPIAQAFRVSKHLPITQWCNHPTLGVSAHLESKFYQLGNAEFCKLTSQQIQAKGQWIYLCENTQLIAAFQLSDQLRASGRRAMQNLAERNIKTHIISGDPSDQVERIAQQLQVNYHQHPLTASDKLHYLTQLKGPTLMVGDGVNDSAVIAAADISVAMAQGADLTKAQADIILLKEDLSLIDLAIKTSSKCIRIIKQNLIWALLYNLSVLPLAFMGLISPWLAAIGMSASSLVVVFNALRLRR